TTPPPPHKSCKLGEMTMHVMAHHELTSNPSLQSVRFFLQTRFRCKVAPPSRHSLAFRAHRHRLSAFARKKNVRSRAQDARRRRKWWRHAQTASPEHCSVNESRWPFSNSATAQS